MLQFIYFRHAGSEDVPALEVLLREERLLVDDLRLEETIVAVHEKENRILGCGRIHAENGAFELADLVVNRDHRGQGIGRFLAQRILERQEKPVFLVTRRHDLPFFQGLGFREATEDEVPHWLRDKRDRLQKTLPEAPLVFGVRDGGVVSF